MLTLYPEQMMMSSATVFAKTNTAQSSFAECEFEIICDFFIEMIAHLIIDSSI